VEVPVFPAGAPVRPRFLLAAPPASAETAKASPTAGAESGASPAGPELEAASVAESVRTASDLAADFLARESAGLGAAVAAGGVVRSVASGEPAVVGGWMEAGSVEATGFDKGTPRRMWESACQNESVGECYTYGCDPQNRQRLLRALIGTKAPTAFSASHLAPCTRE
jgi:hypothetical protein